MHTSSKHQHMENYRGMIYVTFWVLKIHSKKCSNYLHSDEESALKTNPKLTKDFTIYLHISST